MGLRVCVKKQLPQFSIDVDFYCEEKRLLALIGPSGAGKTTIIRMIAGLSKPDEGFISFNGQVWFDAEKGINLSPQKRCLGYVFQEYMLFPHLNVYDNVAFAVKNKQEAGRLLKLFNIWHLKDRRENEISGGERQRCAICQSLAREPRILLLDEPFSALDVNTRKNMRSELKALRHYFHMPIIHVTHDISEAVFLGDDVLPLVSGKITRKWMFQFMLKERTVRQAENSAVISGLSQNDERKYSVLFDSMEVSH